jgi:hypothetical protein
METSQSRNFAEYFFTQYPNKNIGAARWKPRAGNTAHDIYTFSCLSSKIANKPEALWYFCFHRFNWRKTYVCVFPRSLKWGEHRSSAFLQRAASVCINQMQMNRRAPPQQKLAKSNSLLCAFCVLLLMVLAGRRMNRYLTLFSGVHSELEKYLSPSNESPSADLDA